MRIFSLDIVHVNEIIYVLWDKQTGYQLPSNKTVYLVCTYFDGDTFQSFQPPSWHLTENLGTCSAIM